LNIARKLWEKSRNLLPVEGFYFDRPLVLFQSDDWGRVGVRDQQGWEQLRAEGINLGERPYDFYTLETAEDVAALGSLLHEHRDSAGHHPCIEMNFILFNLDFGRMRADNFASIHLLPLSDGLPEGWSRTGLLEAYREGIRGGLFATALHGTTHFCCSAVEAHLDMGDHGELLRTLWRAGTPYIYWRMPWIGYEYWDPGKTEDERFLSVDQQRECIGAAVGAFAKMFSALPKSACAPGYRANEETHRVWAQHGIHVAQNGPGTYTPPYFDRKELLHLSRTVEFEPATDSEFSMERALSEAEACFERGLPAIISMHSINFHSTLRNFRSQTLNALEQFLQVLESRNPGLLYLRDEEMVEVIRKGKHGDVSVKVTKKAFTKARPDRQVHA